MNLGLPNMFRTPLFLWFPSSLVLSSTAVILVIISVKWLRKYHKLRQAVDQIPGPYALPLLGNALQLIVPIKMFSKMTFTETEVFQSIIQWSECYGKTMPCFRLWAGVEPIVFMTSPDAVKAVLSSNVHINKNFWYDFMQPLMGTGLLTSGGQKWFTRRRMITPAFHFNMVDNFIEVFNEQSMVLVDQMKSCTSVYGGQCVDLLPYVIRCTHDIICAGTMGTRANSQERQDIEYLRAIYKLLAVFLMRQVRPWLQPTLLFNLSPYAAEQKQSLEKLHSFSSQVIRKRKEDLLNCNGTSENSTDRPNDPDTFSKKKRLPLLDLLLANSREGLSDADIKEEVDTFIVAGHVSTAVAIIWCLFLVGENPEIEAKVYEEITQVLGTNPNKPITMQDLCQLKYLECCIKEAHRLFPSVPILGRILKEDLIVENYRIPAGCTAMIFLYMLHRNASIFPDPEAFKPERFFPENCVGRHPYAYVPFSAGPRNCIGQKFALMEEKVVLANIFRHFRVKPVDKRENIDLLFHVVLLPKGPMNFFLEPRWRA